VCANYCALIKERNCYELESHKYDDNLSHVPVVNYPEALTLWDWSPVETRLTRYNTKYKCEIQRIYIVVNRKCPLRQHYARVRRVKRRNAQGGKSSRLRWEQTFQLPDKKELTMRTYFNHNSHSLACMPLSGSLSRVSRVSIYIRPFTESKRKPSNETSDKLCFSKYRNRTNVCVTKHCSIRLKFHRRCDES